jgi:hypothetical protein
MPPRSTPLTNRGPKSLRIQSKLSRPFSSTPSSKATLAVPPTAKELLKQMGQRKSRKVEMQKISNNKLPEDVGIIEQTFIRPPNREMPRLFSSKWKTRLKVEWLWVKTRALNFAS